MQIITSKDNEIIKNIRKLKEKKYRDANNEYLIEGIKLIKEAVEEKAKIKLIVVGLNIIPLTLTFLIIYFI